MNGLFALKRESAAGTNCMSGSMLRSLTNGRNMTRAALHPTNVTGVGNGLMSIMARNSFVSTNSPVIILQIMNNHGVIEGQSWTFAASSWVVRIVVSMNVLVLVPVLLVNVVMFLCIIPLNL